MEYSQSRSRGYKNIVPENFDFFMYAIKKYNKKQHRSQILSGAVLITM